MTATAGSTGCIVQPALVNYIKKMPHAQQREVARALRKRAKRQNNEQSEKANRQRVVHEMEEMKREVQTMLLNGTLSVAKLRQLQDRLEKLWGCKENEKPRADNAKGALPSVDAAPATTDTGIKHGPIARALVQLAERREAQKKTKEEAKRNRPWRNVPEYYAKQRERLKHRPAKASNDAVRAYRRRVIDQQRSNPLSTSPPKNRPTTTIRFKEGHDVQTFDLGQPATTVSKWAAGRAELSLTAAEKSLSTRTTGAK